MKTYLAPEEIAAVWVRQSQETGRCTSNMHFSGRKFYSYGTVVAELLTHLGKSVFLVNSWHYSDTTSRHVNLVRCAIPKRAKRFEVPGVHRGSYVSFSDPERILKGWKAQADRLIADSAKAREPKATRLIIEARQVTITMREFAAFFGLSLDDYPVALPLSEKAILKIIRERKAREPIALREREERARLAHGLRRHLPEKAITTRHVYECWKKATAEAQEESK
jgi:hypothetical protein